MKLGETLRDLRNEKGLTQVQACKKLKISQTYLSQVEGGKKEPSPEMIRKFCKFYDVPGVVIAWKSTEEKDVPKNKRSAYRDLKPAIDGLIEEIMKRTTND
jgi:transcriptional regulator with XRE-family HTH domain